MSKPPIKNIYSNLKRIICSKSFLNVFVRKGYNVESLPGQGRILNVIDLNDGKGRK